jgi:flagellar biosynthesis/type III secretory pathway chaperone
MQYQLPQGDNINNNSTRVKDSNGLENRVDKLKNLSENLKNMVQNQGRILKQLGEQVQQLMEKFEKGSLPHQLVPNP